MSAPDNFIDAPEMYRATPMTALTTRETADHAELARKFEVLAVEASAARNIDGAESMMVSVQTIYDLIVSRNALLSEIAALRGDLTETRVAADLLVSSLRADLRQAERQRDELRKVLEPFADEFGAGIPRPDDFQIVGNLNLGHFRRATEALANQGADQ